MASILAINSDSVWAQAAMSAANTNDRGDVERREDMACNAIIHIDDIDLIPEQTEQSVFPMPVLYMSGHIKEVRGDFGHGVDNLVFANDEDTGMYSNPAPDVRFRYQFTPNQLTELAMKGLWQPDFEMKPSIMVDNDYEIPVLCDVTTIAPQREGEFPVNILAIKGAGCLDTSSAESGYVLSNYFEPAPSMAAEANMVMRMDHSAQLDDLVEVDLSNMLFADDLRQMDSKQTAVERLAEMKEEREAELENPDLAASLFTNAEDELVSEVLSKFEPPVKPEAEAGIDAANVINDLEDVMSGDDGAMDEELTRLISFDDIAPGESPVVEGADIPDILDSLEDDDEFDDLLDEPEETTTERNARRARRLHATEDAAEHALFEQAEALQEKAEREGRSVDDGYIL